MMVMEILKHRYHNGRTCNLNFFRDAKGHEVDIVYTSGNRLFPMEIKAGETFRNEFLKQLTYFDKLFGTGEQSVHGALLYGGDLNQRRSGVEVLNYLDVDNLLKELDLE